MLELTKQEVDEYNLLLGIRHHFELTMAFNFETLVLDREELSNAFINYNDDSLFRRTIYAMITNLIEVYALNSLNINNGLIDEILKLSKNKQHTVYLAKHLDDAINLNLANRDIAKSKLEIVNYNNSFLLLMTIVKEHLGSHPKQYKQNLYKEFVEVIKFKLIELNSNTPLKNNLSNLLLSKISALKCIGDADIIIYYILVGGNINIKDGYGNSLLMESVYKGNYIISQFLITYGIDVNLFNYQLATALHHSALRPKIKIFKLLIINGANPNLQDNSRESPLMILIDQLGMETNDLSIMKTQKIIKFLTGFPDINTNIIDKDGETALHKATHLLQLETVQLLLDNGADVTIKNFGGKVPLNIVRANLIKLALNSVKAENNLKIIEILETAMATSILDINTVIQANVTNSELVANNHFNQFQHSTKFSGVSNEI